MNETHGALGHVLRALAAIKDCWDDNRDFQGWEAFAAEFAHPARVEALIFAALMIADRAGLSAIDLEAWGDEEIAAARHGH